MAKGYTGKSGSDRAFDKMDKFMSRGGKWDDGVKTLKEQLDDLKNRSFQTYYPTFALWERKLMELLRKHHSVIDHVFAYEDNFGKDWRKLFREKFDKEIMPNIAMTELVADSKYF